MSDKSPLFVSASELLAHAIELYFEGTERKYKFVILHLANAIELILKDRIIDSGSSIYKSPSTTTITIWDAFTILDKAGVNTQERPIIELLIDDRNTIQHRFGFPNGNAVFYYLDQVLQFFRRFLKAEYAVDVVELLRLYVKEEHLVTLGLVKRDDEVAPLDRLFELSPEAAVLQAYSLVEHKLSENVAPESNWREYIGPYGFPPFQQLLNQLATAGFLSVEDLNGFRNLREMRNRAAHAAHFSDAVPQEAWRAALDTSKNIIEAMDKAATAGLFDKIAAEGHRREAERQGAETVDTGSEVQRAGETSEKQPHENGEPTIIELHQAKP